MKILSKQSLIVFGVCVRDFFSSVNLLIYRTRHFQFKSNYDQLNGLEFVCLKFRAKIKFDEGNRKRKINNILGHLVLFYRRRL